MNQTVVVFGCGPIGLLCQAVAKAAAAKKVIGVDVSNKRLEMAISTLGCADGVFAPPTMDLPVAKRGDVDAEVAWNAKVADMIREQFGLGDGPDVVLEASGAQACIQTGVQLVRKGGMYVQAGMGREVRRGSMLFSVTTDQSTRM
jgi:D-xylulose reductase